MSIRIVETSEEAFSRMKKEQVHCPECKFRVYGGVYHIESSGFLWTKSTKITTYTCGKCRCKFEVRTPL